MKLNCNINVQHFIETQGPPVQCRAIDLNRAYQQLSVREEDVEKTAIITLMGLFEFPRISTIYYSHPKAKTNIVTTSTQC